MCMMRGGSGPNWLAGYEDIIAGLRYALYEFENGHSDFQSFINGINRSLVNCGYDPVKVVISNFMTGFFDAYAIYAPRRPAPIIYVSTELMEKPRPLLGRVLMHEVFHHVLYQRPPSLLFKLVPRRVEPLILLIIPLITVVTLTALLSTSLLSYIPYMVTALLTVMSLITVILIRALNEHELVATALVIYLITGVWVRDWSYYRNENALMSIRWSESVRPREVIVM